MYPIKLQAATAPNQSETAIAWCYLQVVGVHRWHNAKHKQQEARAAAECRSDIIKYSLVDRVAAGLVTWPIGAGVRLLGPPGVAVICGSTSEALLSISVQLKGNLAVQVLTTSAACSEKPAAAVQALPQEAGSGSQLGPDICAVSATPSLISEQPPLNTWPSPILQQMQFTEPAFPP